MSNSLFLYVGIALVSIFASSISQVMLKKAAMREYKNIMAEYFNPLVISAYALFFCCSLVMVFVYRGIPLSLGPVLEATGYIYITLFGVVIFEEKINVKKLIALGLIIIGIVIYVLMG